MEIRNDILKCLLHPKWLTYHDRKIKYFLYWGTLICRIIRSLPIQVIQKLNHFEILLFFETKLEEGISSLETEMIVVKLLKIELGLSFLFVKLSVPERLIEAIVQDIIQKQFIISNCHRKLFIVAIR